MAYERHSHEPAHEPAPVHDPDRGSLTGYAAVKYTAIVIVVLAILAFLWMVLDRLVF